MAKRYFKYADIMLDSRGRYTPSHTIYIPKLIGKAEIFDEVKTWIQTPNTLLNFGYVEYDISIDSDITELFSLTNMHWISELSVEEAKTMLVNNNYVDDWTGTFEITPETTIWEEVIPAVTLTIE